MVRSGGLLSGVVSWVLEPLSSLIGSRHLQHLQSTYANFAAVTAPWWFHLQADLAA